MQEVSEKNLSSKLCFALSRPHCSFMGMMISHDMLLGRWRLSLELFGRVFMEDVGAEPGSVRPYLIAHTCLVALDTEDIRYRATCM